MPKIIHALSSTLSNLTFVCAIALAMSACSDSSSDPAPKVGSDVAANSLAVGEVYTDIYNYHPSFYAKWGSAEGMASIKYNFLVRLNDDEQVPDNISLAFISDETSQEFYTLIDEPYGLAPGDYFNPHYRAHHRFSFSYRTPHRVNLHNWALYVTDIEGNDFQFDFNFKLPNGLDPSYQRYVYSPLYEETRGGGVPAMEAMTIANNRLRFKSLAASQSFRFEFESTDLRAHDYLIWFYEDVNDTPYLARATSLNSPTIASTPIHHGGRTIVEMPWSELPFNSEAVAGAHIVLLNEPVWNQYEEAQSWISYLGVSEYLPLP